MRVVQTERGTVTVYYVRSSGSALLQGKGFHKIEGVSLAIRFSLRLENDTEDPVEAEAIIGDHAAVLACSRDGKAWIVSWKGTVSSTRFFYKLEIQALILEFNL